MMAEIKLTIDKAVKKIIGAYAAIDGKVRQLFWQSVVNDKIEDFINYTKLISQTIQIPESTSQSRTYSLTVDNLVSVESIKVDTGKVSYTIDGNKINISCTDGASRSEYDSRKYSKFVTDSVNVTLESSISPKFPSYFDYNKDGYSGTLNKNGSETIASRYTQTGGSRYATKSHHFDLTFTNGNVTGGSVPQSIFYSEGGYSGTLNLIEDNQYDGLVKTTENLFIEKYTGSLGFSLNYGGTVKEPDKEMIVWEQKYNGLVYSGGYNYYYKYTININYKILAN